MRALEAACEGHGITSVYQPIVDTARRTVAGYEALIRFPAFEEKNPEVWFRAARRHGVAAELEAAALRSALSHRSTVPTNCFLTVNVSPDVLATECVRTVWAEQGNLAGLIVELTEQAPVDSYIALEPDLNRLKAAGALIAVDDAGSGYAGLQHLLSIRPAMIKIDRKLIQGVDDDEAKRALIEMLGMFAGRIDAWILAEGVEHIAELDVLCSLRVPLVQGYLLGRPAPPWARLDDGIAHRLVSGPAPTRNGTLRDVVEPVPSFTDLADATEALAADDQVREIVLLGADHRPVAVLTEEDTRLGIVSQGIRANLDTPVAEALSRSITRERPYRFDPLLVTDNAGRLAGIARLERMISAVTTGSHEVDAG
ncbi:EAL domain-containing protein [Arthrobacter cheniae]|uniref:EAL domain-containing protein n=1 Tax=Arthrobacter cheniae TaxID=1258888 RepID=A0A3A5MB50_9MICC|nr:EAL domain-containing protein [Arthrobacter cheniae]